MNVISTAFWGEGPSDERFLPKIIQRTLESVLLQCAQGEWEVLEPCIMKSAASNFVEQVIDIAQKSVGFTLVFVHTDADASDENQKAMPFKVNPALERLNQLSEDMYCKHIVAVIPVTKVENWKLSDLEALQSIFGVSLDWTKLGLNIGVQQLEQRANSKELLEDAMKAATQLRGRRRNSFTLEDIDETLAKRISMQNIARFKSFQNFLERLKMSLTQQNIINDNCDITFV
jgi:hypothetical protein